MCRISECVLIYTNCQLDTASKYLEGSQLGNFIRFVSLWGIVRITDSGRPRQLCSSTIPRGLVLGYRESWLPVPL